MSKKRIWTLFAAIANTVTTLILIGIFSISFNQDAVNGFNAGAQGSARLSIGTASMIGILIMSIAILGCILTWISFAKPNLKILNTFLLIYGILSIFPGMFFTLFLSIISGLLMIVASRINDKVTNVA
ncbi:MULTISPECIES: hypothetical protein [unclassified Lactococcus]|uniref:hypothetical protein n=1 Tax=unclassified Lactococcus TaxID=2643510 RepID=UPI0011C8EAF0|nr:MULTISPECIES: hypothetical protein [unclassified Lactococcus]MQW23339.1 hypothetical protein [Lactococcus sp. dk101]TXK37959.1 hypothetical protein FVP42_07175 [Lactococcus sp. dk310]TXK49613.1 hypothetical protein FVP43_07145 [Lactococcus sp. dk322]